MKLKSQLSRHQARNRPTDPSPVVVTKPNRNPLPPTLDMILDESKTLVEDEPIPRVILDPRLDKEISSIRRGLPQVEVPKGVSERV